MGYVPPPLRPTEEEIRKRISEGANTMAEIDPEFTKWMLSGPVGWLRRIFKTEEYQRLYRKLW